MVGEYLQKFRLPIGLALVGIVLIIGGVFASGLNKAKPKDLPAGRQDYPKESIVSNQKLISIDVSGAVKTPGVYQVKDGSRIEEAIVSAGGFSENANKGYISKYLNMAQKLSDGSKIYVPFAGEQGTMSQSSGTVAGAQVSAIVNINTATQAELEALSGIGPVTASNIISDRPYQTVEDLLNKKIVKQAVFEKIKDQLIVY